MKRIFTTIALLVIAVSVWSQCVISFTTSVSGNVVTFTPSSTSSGISYNVWDTPGASPSSQSLYVTSNATVTYNGVGTYNACVTMYDSAWNCWDSACATVVIGSINLTTSTSATDAMCFQCNGSATASPSGGTSPYTYSWSNGASSQTISSLCSGNYTVTVNDVNGATAVSSVFVDNDSTGSLSASVVDNNETCLNCCDGSISVSVSGGSGNYTYQWSNNGGNTSSQSNLCPGSYAITITDNSSGCVKIKTATVSPYVCPSLQGIISPTGDARVYLIQENNGILSAADSVDTDSGYYYFPTVCPGTYYVKGALLPNNSLYGSYIPTYNTSAALWVNATQVTVTSGGAANVNFSLISGINQGGPGFIAGSIAQGANRSEGDPVSGATIIAFDADGMEVAYAISDENGEYELVGLELGSYTIKVDILNKTSHAHEVTLTSETPNGYGYNFEVMGDLIKPIDATGVNDLVVSELEIYPNPAQQQLNINTGSIIVESWKLYNVLGEVVKSGTNSNAATMIQVDMITLPAGNFILQLESEEGVLSERVMKF